MLFISFVSEGVTRRMLTWLNYLYRKSTHYMHTYYIHTYINKKHISILNINLVFVFSSKYFM